MWQISLCRDYNSKIIESTMKDFCNFYYMKRRWQQSQCFNPCSLNCAKRFQEPYVIEQDYQAFIKWQKQPSRGSLWKMCSENMQQMYRRTPTWKCDFNEVVLQHIYRKHPCGNVISIKLLCSVIEITLPHRCSPVNVSIFSEFPFPRKTSEGLLLKRAGLFLRCTVISSVFKDLRCSFFASVGAFSRQLFSLKAPWSLIGF